METADTARNSNGRIAQLQKALSELAASQVAVTEAESRCARCIALVVLRDLYGGEKKAKESLDGSR